MKCLLVFVFSISLAFGQVDTFEYSDTEFEVGQVKRLRNVYFIYASPPIEPRSHPALDSLVLFLKNNKRLRVEVGGHIDSRGSKNYSRRLDQARADAVKDYLVAKGIKEKRLAAKGYGESEPFIDCEVCTEEEHLSNRRVEVKIIEL